MNKQTLRSLVTKLFVGKTHGKIQTCNLFQIWKTSPLDSPLLFQYV